MASYASTPLPEGLTLRDPKTGDFCPYSYADLVAEFARPLDYSLLEEDIKPTIIGKKIVELRDPRTGDMRAYSFIELHYELQCRYQIEMKQQGRWKSDQEVTEEAENSYYSPEASALMDANMENYSILTDPEAECVRRVANFWTMVSMVPYLRAQNAAEERVAREGGRFEDYFAIERERQGV
ncbi:hypothetical protein EV715DRAFT_273554 [Schizophyllum commune]